MKDKEYLQGNINKRLVTAFSSSKIKVPNFIDLYLDFRYAKNAMYGINVSLCSYTYLFMFKHWTQVSEALWE